MIILDAPFDETANSPIAYDYSQFQKHFTATNAGFVSGHNGNAIHFTGNGYARNQGTPIVLSGNFTIMYWFRNFKTETFEAPLTFKVRFGFPDDTESNLLGPIIPLNTWKHIAIVKNGPGVIVYIDGLAYGNITLTSSNPDSWMVEQIFAGGAGFPYILPLTFGSNTPNYSTCDIDQLLIFNTALTPSEIKQQMNPQAHDFYIIDGRNFKEFDVFVEGSTGLVDALELKEPVKVNWANEHGTIVDLHRPRKKDRTIELDCWIRGLNMVEWTMKMNAFLEIFQTPDLHRLECRISENRPLLFTCYLADYTKIQKAWKNGEFFGKFTLKLTDPQPVRRILRFIVGITDSPNDFIAKIRFSCQHAVNIYWGDGSFQNDVLAGNDLLLTHTYSSSSLNTFYEIMITGEPNNLTNFSHNCIMVWNRL